MRTRCVKTRCGVDERFVARGDYTSFNGYRAMKRMLINSNKPTACSA